MDDSTIISNKKFDMSEKEIKKNIKDVYNTLEEKGYNATSQIVGYLLSGDLGYISSYKNARNKMALLDRGEVVETLLNNYLK